MPLSLQAARYLLRNRNPKRVTERLGWGRHEDDDDDVIDDDDVDDDDIDDNDDDDDDDDDDDERSIGIFRYFSLIISKTRGHHWKSRPIILYFYFRKLIRVYFLINWFPFENVIV